jgi:hypothetical protein
MDDLFEGYMEMDALADFLVDKAPVTKQPKILPRTRQHAQQPDELISPPTSIVNGQTQWYAFPETVYFD